MVMSPVAKLESLVFHCSHPLEGMSDYLKRYPFSGNQALI
jgi:hypothetical protein